jgi:hypothetical protein
MPRGPLRPKSVPGHEAIGVQMNERVLPRWNCHNQLRRYQVLVGSVVLSTGAWAYQHNRRAIGLSTDFCWGNRALGQRREPPARHGFLLFGAKAISTPH